MIPVLVPRAVRSIWGELPAVLCVCAIWTASLTPFLVALLSSAPAWMGTGAVLPVALASTGLARVAEDLSVGERVRTRRMFDMDPALAALATATVGLASLLLAVDGWVSAVGFVLAAVACLTLPMALSCGAANAVHGAGALRDGLLLAVQRPGTAVSLAAMGVLGGFAVIASGGVLVLVVPALMALIASQCVTVALPGEDLGKVWKET